MGPKFLKVFLVACCCLSPFLSTMSLAAASGDEKISRIFVLPRASAVIHAKSKAAVAKNPKFETKATLARILMQTPDKTPRELTFQFAKELGLNELDYWHGWAAVANFQHDGNLADVKGAVADITFQMIPSDEIGLETMKSFIKRHEGQDFMGRKVHFANAIGYATTNEVLYCTSDPCAHPILIVKQWSLFTSYDDAEEWYISLNLALKQKNKAEFLRLCALRFDAEKMAEATELYDQAGLIEVSGSPVILTDEKDPFLRHATSIFGWLASSGIH